VLNVLIQHSRSTFTFGKFFTNINRFLAVGCDEEAIYIYKLRYVGAIFYFPENTKRIIKRVPNKFQPTIMNCVSSW